MECLIRGMAREEKIRIIGCDCKETISTICSKHDTYPIATIALGRFLCATLMLGAELKDTQTITCVLNGGGTLGTIFAQSNARGDIRGFVSNPDIDSDLVNNRWDIESAVGNSGTLNVIKSFDEENNFTSQVAIRSGDIAQAFASYFFESEQIPTIINVGVELNNDGSVKYARGYLIQLITGYDDSDIEFLENLKLADLDNDIDSVILSMFSDFKKLTTSPVGFKCDCSKQKFEKGLKSLQKDEIRKILEEEGQIETMCNFCSEKYLFTREEIEKILNED